MFTGSYCVNPMTGEDVPIWLANYVVSDYGSGAVMAVPAHDERDFDFAQQYDLPIKFVIVPADSGNVGDLSRETAFTAPGVLIDSGDFSGLPSKKPRSKSLSSWKAMASANARPIIVCATGA
jgi:leucyl-tRNA synthetase